MINREIYIHASDNSYIYYYDDDGEKYFVRGKPVATDSTKEHGEIYVDLNTSNIRWKDFHSDQIYQIKGKAVQETSERPSNELYISGEKDLYLSKNFFENVVSRNYFTNQGSSFGYSGDINLFIVLDASGSMDEVFGSGTRISSAKNALVNFVNGLPLSGGSLNLNVGYAYFRISSTIVESEISTFNAAKKSSIISKISNTPVGGGTPIESALNTANNRLNGLSGINIAVFVGDLFSSSGQNEAYSLQNNGIELKLIGIELTASQQSTASTYFVNPSESYFRNATTLNELQSGINESVEIQESQNIIRLYKNPERTINVLENIEIGPLEESSTTRNVTNVYGSLFSYSEKIKDFDIEGVRSGYTYDINYSYVEGSDGNFSCNTRELSDIYSSDTNIVIVYDNSGSMDGIREANVKSALKNMIDDLPTDLDISLGFTYFTTSATNLVSLTEVTSEFKTTIKNAIDSVNAGGGTEVDEGLISAINQIQSSNNTNGKNIILLITDAPEGRVDSNQGSGATEEVGQIIENFNISLRTVQLSEQPFLLGDFNRYAQGDNADLVEQAIQDAIFSDFLMQNSIPSAQACSGNTGQIDAICNFYKTGHVWKQINGDLELVATSTSSCRLDSDIGVKTRVVNNTTYVCNGVFSVDYCNGSPGTVSEWTNFTAIDENGEDFYLTVTEYPTLREPDYTQGILNATWYEVSSYYTSNSYASSKSELDNYFNSSLSGVNFGGSEVFTGQISWGDSGQIGAGGLVGAKPSYLPDEGYSWRVDGYIYAPTTGTYEFYCDGDDALDVSVNGQTVASFYGGHGFNGSWTGGVDTSGTIFQTNSNIYLNGGNLYPFYARMQEGKVIDGIQVGWKKPGDSSISLIPGSNFYIQN